MMQRSRLKRLHTGSVLLLVLACTLPAVAQTDLSEAVLAEAALRSPAVASVLDNDRTTPGQKLSAIFTLLDLGETGVAQLFWKDLTDEKLSSDVQAALVRQFGAARFLNLSRRELMDGLSGARTFAEGCLQASAEFNRDPQRLAKLVVNLSNDSVEIRQAARADLAVVGNAGAVVCFESLAQAPAGEAGKRLRTELMLTLTKLRPDVEPMLVAALAEGRGQFRRDLVELAGHLHLQSSLPWLSAFAAGADRDPEIISAAIAALTKIGLSVPGPGAAQALIRSQIQRLESATITDDSDTDDSDITWWTWHHATPPETKPGPGKMVSANFSAAMIHKLAINRLASTLLAIGIPSEIDHQTALIYYLETVQVIGKAEGRELEKLPTQRIIETLAKALQGDHIAAATRCASALGQQASATALHAINGRRSALALALTHPERELRYTALEAIMEISPQQSFAGASGVGQTLWYFAESAGTPQAVAASSVVSQASDWAGQLRSLGYDATPVTTGRDAVLTARSLPRLELILLDSDIGRPRMREILYGFRSHASLQRVPVAVLSSLHNLAGAKQIARTDAYLLATPRPHSDQAMQAVLSQLANLGGEKLTAKRRTEQAAAALGWLAQLLETGHPYDELLRDAGKVGHTLFNPELTTVSMRLLAVLGTANSQRLLLDYASTSILPLESRQAATDAFAKSVARFGKLLTSDELLRQYDRYNASETADSETQKLLGQVLDTLEKQK